MTATDLYPGELPEGGTEQPGIAGCPAPVITASNVAAATLAAEEFLAALGVSLNSEHLRQTPARMARAWAQMLTPRPFSLTTFPNDGGYEELLLIRDIPFQSVCEHHFLPFTGTAHVGYLPGPRIVGLSKLARVVEMFAARPQTQERLTSEIAHWLAAELDARGVGVALDAEHSCMTLRGVRASGALTRTKALTGALRFDTGPRSEFLAEAAG